MFKFHTISAIIFLSISCSTSQSEKNKITEDVRTIKKITPLKDSVPDLDSLNDKVRYAKISKEEALSQLKILLPVFKNYFYAHGGKNYNKTDWVFPLEGYNSSNIGGKNGSGYIDDGYNYFDGNKHKGHPAHDIFIHDTNQDCMDDKTKQVVNVLSLTEGIVLAIETRWDSASDQRGGNYIWIYDFSENSFFYYAHNSEVLVKPGTIVKPGDVIAHVGRTGANAFKKRSPTHLHIMQLSFDKNFIPKPTNLYRELLKAKLI